MSEPKNDTDRRPDAKPQQSRSAARLLSPLTLLRRLSAGADAPGPPVAAEARSAPDQSALAQESEWRAARLAALSAMVAKSNHDLRGVLSPALLTAERLQMHADPAVQRHAGLIVRAVERAAEVMRPVAELARETRLPPGRARQALRQLVEQCAERARAALAVENAVPDDIEVEADAPCFARALDLLLAHAARRGTARARIDATVMDADVSLLVTGLPVSEESDDFAGPAPGGDAGGRALDLAIVRDLLRSQGGGADFQRAAEDAPPAAPVAGIRLTLRGLRRPPPPPAAGAAGAAEAAAHPSSRPSENSTSR